MKPGDLVKLVLPRGMPSWAAGVIVSWQRDVDKVSTSTRFPEGTVAVFLGNHRVHGDSSILIDGRVGWVWPDKLEAL